jgi:hypothetical protein
MFPEKRRNTLKPFTFYARKKHCERNENMEGNRKLTTVTEFLSTAELPSLLN